MTQTATAAGRKHHAHFPHFRHRVSAPVWADIHRLRYEEHLGIRGIARTVHLPRRTIRKILSPWN